MKLLKPNDAEHRKLDRLKMVHFPKTDVKVLRDYWEHILDEFANQRLIEAIRDTLHSGEHSDHEERTSPRSDFREGT